MADRAPAANDVELIEALEQLFLTNFVVRGDNAGSYRLTSPGHAERERLLWEQEITE